jgi:hypothetical protein
MIILNFKNIVISFINPLIIVFMLDIQLIDPSTIIFYKIESDLP